MTPALYTASVPVFLHYLTRIEALADQGPAALDMRLADAFPAEQQFRTAVSFSLRVAFPLAGQPIPRLPGPHEGLKAAIATARAALITLQPADFAGGDARMIDHRAGNADLVQTGADFLHLFGMPNFMFHLTMGYASLRAAGVPIGKADFDGFHAYPPGFSF